MEVTDCELWTGAISGNGYGLITWYDKRDKKNPAMGAHRYAWIMANGRDIQPGLQILHLCNVRACVNPEHLKEDTASANAKQMVRDGRQYKPWEHGQTTGRPPSADTHCKHGHEWNEENTYRKPNGWRACRACQRIADRRRRSK